MDFKEIQQHFIELNLSSSYTTPH